MIGRRLVQYLIPRMLQLSVAILLHWNKSFTAAVICDATMLPLVYYGAPKIAHREIRNAPFSAPETTWLSKQRESIEKEIEYLVFFSMVFWPEAP